MRFNLLILLFIISFQNISFAENLNLKCSYFYLKINNGKAAIRLGNTGNYFEPYTYNKTEDFYSIKVKEYFRPNQCRTLITTLYKIDRLTGQITKSIEDFGKVTPKKEWLSEFKKKYSNPKAGESFYKSMIDINCKPKLGLTNVRYYSDLGLTSEDVARMMQNNKSELDALSEQLNYAQCEKLEKKF